MPTKILIVEDNESVRSVLRMVLELEKYEIIEAGDGMRALQCLRTHPDCALVITDLAMPVMDGYELLRRLRGEMKRLDLPILVLSAEKDATSALNQGALRVIRKPFSPIELLDVVRKALAARDQDAPSAPA